MSPTPTPSMTIGPSPSPSHLFVELTNQPSAAPWWGVPVLAGCFLLLGGFLSYLLTRANDKTKFHRDRAERQLKEVVEAGASLLSTGDGLKELALLALPRNTAQFLAAVSGKIKPATEAFALAANAFSLVYPSTIKSEFDRYVLTTSVLLMPPYEKDGQIWALEEQGKAHVRLVNALRALEGREPIDVPQSNENLLEDAQKIVGRLADDLKQNANHGRHSASPDPTGLSQP
ncbi:hypothetical protein DEJ13_17535 [Curtobacterium sp. MCLR17_007]|uniref:hypothetical protein n=1 Tax=Curtobacterium sp. MCLR17_007 TaxID=2175648 RepID=UPI0011B7968E|nr:hypothetical protein [Curtobacterium sp. MCLR17_007]WIB60218.1 hypothetical protein DEJ13_17535 [Curtobacterium sp. MCLR17_007]